MVATGVGTHHSLVTHTGKCGWATSGILDETISNENVLGGVTYALIWARRAIMRRWMITCGISELFILL